MRKIISRWCLWFILLLTLDTPMAFVLSKLFEQPLSAILSGIWGVGVGIIATKLFLIERN